MRVHVKERGISPLVRWRAARSMADGRHCTDNGGRVSSSSSGSSGMECARSDSNPSLTLSAGRPACILTCACVSRPPGLAIPHLLERAPVCLFLLSFSAGMEKHDHTSERSVPIPNIDARRLRAMHNMRASAFCGLSCLAPPLSLGFLHNGELAASAFVGAVDVRG